MRVTTKTSDRIPVHASAPARFRQAVGFCCDNRYLPFAVFAARQIAMLHPDRTFDIFIASDEDLTDLDILGQHAIRRLRIDTKGRFTGLWLTHRHTESAYLRLALPAALEEDYDRILYLDSDVYVMAGGFDELFGVDLKGHCIGAVRENAQWRTPGRMPKQFEQFGWESGPYFNSGVMLMDVQGFNEADLMNRCIAFGRENKARMVGCDQEHLNSVLCSNWAELSPIWNWQFTWASRLFALTEGARILHFIGPHKPWSETRGVFPRFITRNFSEFLTDNFPDVPQPLNVETPLDDPRKLGKSLIKHVMSRRKMAAYLGRFENDFTVVSHHGLQM